MRISQEIMAENLARLEAIDYPGRGFVQGINASGKAAIQAYWLMGRSAGSQARMLVEHPDAQSGASLVRTELTPNAPEGTDTSLTIYNAMRSVEGTHIVSNGDQTDTVADTLRAGGTFEDALLTRSYEPDAPNFTPRITGAVTLPNQATGEPVIFKVGLISKSDTSVAAVRTFHTSDPRRVAGKRGVGDLIHTYKGNGDPLPSFSGQLPALPLGETTEEIADTYWKVLNPEFRVALGVKAIDLSSGEESYTIINGRL